MEARTYVRRESYSIYKRENRVIREAVLSATQKNASGLQPWSVQAETSRRVGVQHVCCMLSSFRLLMLQNTVVVTGCLVFLVSLLWPHRAWALQEHGPPEGLYVHMLAHLYFIFALGYLYWDIGRTLFEGRGWRYLQTFCVLMVIWNIMTVAGHAASCFIDVVHFASPGTIHARLLPPITPLKLLYYIAKFDHFVCVPALFFLFLGIRSFYLTVDQQFPAGEEE